MRQPSLREGFRQAGTAMGALEMRTIYTKASRSTRLQVHRDRRARPFGGVVQYFTGLVLSEESCYFSVGFPVVLEDKRVFQA